MNTEGWTYDAAFARNVGLVSAKDVAVIRKARIGVAGLGGCGSNHLLTLARMGFERFVIADPDHFEIANFNRQAGAFIDTIGHRKTAVMADMVRKINPRAEIVELSEGLTAESIDGFASSVDIGINAIDFFAIHLYAAYHDALRRYGRYSLVGASPFAFGASLTVIGPETPPFDEVFGILATDDAETQLRKFVARMTPVPFTHAYLEFGTNEIRSPLHTTRISSTAAALQLCSALTAAEVLFTVLGRRPPTLAPRVLQLDLLAQGLSLSFMSGPAN